MAQFPSTRPAPPPRNTNNPVIPKIVCGDPTVAAHASTSEANGPYTGVSVPQLFAGGVVVVVVGAAVVVVVVGASVVVVVVGAAVVVVVVVVGASVVVVVVVVFPHVAPGVQPTFVQSHPVETNPQEDETIPSCATQIVKRFPVSSGPILSVVSPPIQS